jgi:chemotaxis protein methyltransferase CheR
VTGLSFDPAEARLLADIFRQHAGLSFTEEALALLQRRLQPRFQATRAESFQVYLTLLKESPKELEEATELLTTHETYFFRESYQLNAFSREILPQLRERAAKRERLSIWSAGCSTGEEAYTIAMLVDASGLFADWDIRVVGSDLSRRCINAAKRAVYQQGAFRTTPREMRAAYFQENDEGTVVAPHIRRLCSFHRGNLLEGGDLHQGRFDAIFCRNVLIYLDSNGRRRVLEGLFERLAPKGFLLLGHSESLLNTACALEPLNLGDDIVYIRPEGAQHFDDLGSRG